MGGCGAKKSSQIPTASRTVVDLSKSSQQAGNKSSNLPILPGTCETIETKLEFLVSREVTETLKLKALLLFWFFWLGILRSSYEVFLRKLIESAKIQQTEYSEYCTFLDGYLQKKRKLGIRIRNC